MMANGGAAVVAADAGAVNGAAAGGGFIQESMMTTGTWLIDKIRPVYEVFFQDTFRKIVLNEG